METVDLLNVPIFSVGTWEGKGSAPGGDKIDSAFLDVLVDSFEKVGKYVKPRMVLTHDKGKSQSVTGMAALGWVTSLKREGDKLFADIKNIPKKIADVIRKKAFGRFSPGVWTKMNVNGVDYENVLEHLALLGSDLPANTDLDGFIDLYYDHNEYDVKNFVKYEKQIITESGNDKHITYENKIPEGKKMDFEKLYNELKAEVENQKKDFQKVETEKENQLKEFAAKVEQLGKEKAELESKIAEEKQVAYQKEVDVFVEKMIADGKILPSQKPAIMALVSEAGNEKTFAYAEGSEKKEVRGNNFELLKQFMDNQPKIIDFSQQSQHAEVDKTEKTDDEQLHEKAIAYQKDHKDVTYREALMIVSKE